ncbi:MAG: hypothetical protein IPM77_06125 [Crocinitomicaceae bacterium]|nr:hypothetical protein [Crocinitomicaceae bacterium]
MKYIIFVLTILIFASCGSSVTADDTNTEVIDSTYCECSELTFDQPYNHFWRFERRKGFTGVCEEFYPDGKLKMTKPFQEGKIHGKLIMYYDNGQIEDQKEFDMNFQVGEQFTYTKKGELKYHARYKRGTLDTIFVNRPDLLNEEPFGSN